MSALKYEVSGRSRSNRGERACAEATFAGALIRDLLILRSLMREHAIYMHEIC